MPGGTELAELRVWAPIRPAAPTEWTAKQRDRECDLVFWAGAADCPLVTSQEKAEPWRSCLGGPRGTGGPGGDARCAPDLLQGRNSPAQGLSQLSVSPGGLGTHGPLLGVAHIQLMWGSQALWPQPGAPPKGHPSSRAPGIGRGFCVTAVPPPPCYPTALEGACPRAHPAKPSECKSPTQSLSCAGHPDGLPRAGLAVCHFLGPPSATVSTQTCHLFSLRL